MCRQHFRSVVSILAVGLFFAACHESVAPLPSGLSRPRFGNAPGGGLHGAIAFHSNRDGGVFEIFAMNADGTGVTQLTHTTEHNFDPIWSPNGNQIAFSRFHGCCFTSVVVINADGSGETVLVDNGFAGAPGAWSPDGKRILFARPEGGHDEIFVMNADGSGVTQLTSNEFAFSFPHSWSPDGKRIAFSSDRDGNPELYVMNADGTGITRLTNNPALDGYAEWSPDGMRFVFSSDRDGGHAHVFVMNADGTGVTQLTSGDFYDDGPSWSPDGKRIAFHTNRDGNEEIYVMNADGTGPTRLTFNQGTFNSIASWRARPLTANLSSLPIRGLYVQFERRGWGAEYWPGQVIQNFDQFDAVVGHTVAVEVALQLDSIRGMGVNTITYELRATDPAYVPGTDGFPTCSLPPVLGLQWPQPTSTELKNLVALFDLVHAKGMRILLRLVNTHQEEQPPTNSARWLGAILGAVKLHPALELVSFEGDSHFLDKNGDGTPDACGVPAEPPLWLGPNSVAAKYVQWAIGYARSLGVPARKLSAEAIVGDFFVESEAPAGWNATDGHLWKPVAVLKGIFDNLGIPDADRTYAISFYEHRKCSTAQWLPCVDADPGTWAEQTLQGILATIGSGSGARVVASEMGLLPPAETGWSTEQALESLLQLFTKYGVDGGAFWRWTSFSNGEDVDPTLAQPVKRRGVAFTYNPVKDVLVRYYKTP